MKSGGHTLRETWRTLRESARLRSWLRVGTLVFTLGFLVFLLIQGRDELRQFDDWPTYLAVCGQGLLLYPLSLAVQAWAWGGMIARLGQVPRGWHDAEIYAYTHLMRRLPGAVWYLAGRTVIYQERGIRAAVTLAASGLEFSLLIAVAAVLAGVLSLPGHNSWLLSPAALALLVLVVSRGMAALASGSTQRWLPGFVRDRLANLPAAALPRARDVALWSTLYATAYAVGGLILLLLTRGVAPQSGLTLIDAIRIWALSGGLGFLTSMIIPAGMGIRELTLTALLAPYMPAIGALLIAVLLRLLFIAGDLVWGGLMWAIARALGSR